MIRVVLRRSAAAPVCADEAARLVHGEFGGEVLSHDDRNLLADIAPAHLGALQARLEGWVVAAQGAKIAVPDTRVKLRGKPAD